MKILAILLLPVLIISGCNKSEIIPMMQAPITEKWPPVSRPLPRSPRINQTVCIATFDELVQILGGTSVQVRSVILENGTTITVTPPVTSIIYSAVNLPAPSSLFNSQLSVTHNYYGVDQTHFTDTWSLGCVYTNAGNGPFTNILKGNDIILVNTSFVWSVPPYNTQHLRVLWIVL